MSECRFMHVGMTVSDLQQTEAFYTRYFGFKQTLDSCFKPEFLQPMNPCIIFPMARDAALASWKRRTELSLSSSSSASRFHARQLFGTSPAITISA